MSMPDWLADFKNSSEFKELAARPIAYFCAEFALDPNLPIYAGGLGILAGDYIREVNDLLIPAVGVGLYYNTINNLHLQPMVDSSGSKLLVEVPLGDRTIKVQIFKYLVGETPVYLLDTNVEENAAGDRQITDKLYVADKELRLKQEIILGIGGLRALEMLKIHPLKYHLNEGHSAFLALDLIRHEMTTQHVDLEGAIKIVRERVVFTNHTLLPAGREVYSNDLVSLMLEKYAQEVGIPVVQLTKLGQVQESSAFSMTMLSLRMSKLCNAVSRLHAKKGTDIWADHPMQYVTNGIHIPTWDSLKTDISVHPANKQKLLDLIRTQLGLTWSSETLLFGWARRFVEYKRPLAILEDLDRFCDLARNVKRPFKVIFAGEPHQSDIVGQNLILKLNDLIKEKIGDIAVYLPGYNMQLAHTLVAGCDVWLNTPIVGFEACGTSGMKAALNGTLPLTTRDGWVEEIELFRVGWALDSDNISANILDTIEHNIAPMFYEQKDEWHKLMQDARDLVLNQFSTTRMVHEYLDKLYFPKNT